MKKLFLVPLLALLLLVVVGCTTNNTNSNSNQNKNTNQQTGVQDFRPNVLNLTDSQELIDGGNNWQLINDSENQGEDSAKLTQDEWQGSPIQVLKELYFTSNVSGEAINQANHIENLTAKLTGIMVVYNDGSVGGTGIIEYTGNNNNCEMDQDDSGIITCEVASLEDGTFNITGDMVEFKNKKCQAEDWFGKNYWMNVFFMEDNMPKEKVNYLNNIVDSKTPTENFNLHTLLFEGPFGQYSLMCPYMYDSNGLLTINGSLATGTMDLEFTDNLNNVDFNSLRETMGLTVQ